MDVPVLADQEHLYRTQTKNSSVQTQDVVYKTCWEQWMIGINGERNSGKSVLAARLDDDGSKFKLMFYILDFYFIATL